METRFLLKEEDFNKEQLAQIFKYLNKAGNKRYLVGGMEFKQYLHHHKKNAYVCLDGRVGIYGEADNYDQILRHRDFGKLTWPIFAKILLNEVITT